MDPLTIIPRYHDDFESQRCRIKKDHEDRGTAAERSTKAATAIDRPPPTSTDVTAPFSRDVTAASNAHSALIMPGQAQYESNAIYIAKNGFEVDACTMCARIQSRTRENAFPGCWMLGAYDDRRHGPKGLRKCSHCTGKRLICSNKDKSMSELGLNRTRLKDNERLRPVAGTWPQPTRRRWYQIDKDTANSELEALSDPPEERNHEANAASPGDYDENEEIPAEDDGNEAEIDAHIGEEDALAFSEMQEGRLGLQSSDSSPALTSTPVLRAPPAVLSAPSSPQNTQVTLENTQEQLPRSAEQRRQRRTAPKAASTRQKRTKNAPTRPDSVRRLPVPRRPPASMPSPPPLPPMPRYAHQEQPEAIPFDPSTPLPIFFLPEAREARQGVLRLFSVEELTEHVYRRTRDR